MARNVSRSTHMARALQNASHLLFSIDQIVADADGELEMAGFSRRTAQRKKLAEVKDAIDALLDECRDVFRCECRDVFR